MFMFCFIVTDESDRLSGENRKRSASDASDLQGSTQNGDQVGKMAKHS